MDYSSRRRDYGESVFDVTQLAGNWVEQFQNWFAEADAAGIPEPNAMVLGTAGADGRPTARTVLLKKADTTGLTFFSHTTSGKGSQIAENPAASLVFPWHAMFRQVVVSGDVVLLTRAETEHYFASRPRESQLGAWASRQSEVVGTRTQLDDAMAEAERRFAGVPVVPAPETWSGFRVVPTTVEFWQGRSGRLHDRLRFRQHGATWRVERLFP